MICRFPVLTCGSPCANGCGYVLKRDYPTPPRRNCTPVTNQREPDCGKLKFKSGGTMVRSSQSTGGGDPSEKLPCDGKPSLLNKAANYGKAMTKWAKSRFAMRSRREREAILEICQACEHYQPAGMNYRAHCKKCGCCLSSRANAFANKIAVATEHCPIGKW